MTSERTGVLDGDLNRRAVFLAGALAEAAVQHLVIAAPDGSRRELHARLTDLPQELMKAPPGATLECLACGLSIQLNSERWTWRASDGPVAAALEKYSA